MIAMDNKVFLNLNQIESAQEFFAQPTCSFSIPRAPCPGRSGGGSSGDISHAVCAVCVLVNFITIAQIRKAHTFLLHL